MLPTPRFHHLHLNSVNPGAAIDFYVRQFASTAKASWGGLPALKSPNDVLVLFTKVDTAPAVEPQTAIWHFGWHVIDYVCDSVQTVPEQSGNIRTKGGLIFYRLCPWSHSLDNARIERKKKRDVGSSILEVPCVYSRNWQ